MSIYETILFDINLMSIYETILRIINSYSAYGTRHIVLNAYYDSIMLTYGFKILFYVSAYCSYCTI